MGTIGTSYGNKNAWERLKIRDPKNPPETREFQSFRTSNSERHYASTFWIVLVYCQMMSSVRFCHLKHELCPTKTLTCTILVLDRAWSAAKPVPLAACWMCLCTMYLNSPHSLVRTVRRSFFRHAFTWFLIEVNSNSWSASRWPLSWQHKPSVLFLWLLWYDFTNLPTTTKHIWGAKSPDASGTSIRMSTWSFAYSFHQWLLT